MLNNVKKEDKEDSLNPLIKKYGSKYSGGILSDIFDFSKVKTKNQKKSKILNSYHK